MTCYTGRVKALVVLALPSTSGADRIGRLKAARAVLQAREHAALLQLYALSKRDPAKALERYLRLCEIGGTRSFLGIVKEGGLENPFEPGTLPPLMKMVREELALK